MLGNEVSPCPPECALDGTFSLFKLIRPSIKCSLTFSRLGSTRTIHFHMIVSVIQDGHDSVLDAIGRADPRKGSSLLAYRRTELNQV
jgi:hypothetical protein